jgi:hypothetical protein
LWGLKISLCISNQSSTCLITSLCDPLRPSAQPTNFSSSPSRSCPNRRFFRLVASMQDKQGYCTGTDCVGRIQGAALAVLALAENNIGRYVFGGALHAPSLFLLLALLFCASECGELHSPPSALWSSPLAWFRHGQQSYGTSSRLPVQYILVECTCGSYSTSW